MYVVIVGCGKVGYSLARALMAGEHEVVAIDRDAKRCEAVEEDLGSIAKLGDGCEVGVLAEVGTARADVFIAVTGSDEDNLAACQLAKHRFNVPKTVSLINNPGNAALFKLLQVDVTISSTDLILSHIEEELPAHPLVHLRPILGTNKALVEIKVPPDAWVVGKALKDITLPDGTFFSLIISKEGRTEIPTEDTVFEANAEVIVVTNLDEEEVLWETLTQGS